MRTYSLYYILYSDGLSLSLSLYLSRGEEEVRERGRSLRDRGNQKIKHEKKKPGSKNEGRDEKKWEERERDEERDLVTISV